MIPPPCQRCLCRIGVEADGERDLCDAVILTFFDVSRFVCLTPAALPYSLPDSSNVHKREDEKEIPASFIHTLSSDLR